MADLAVQVRLSAKDDGLVGQLNQTKDQLDQVATAQQKAGAASRDLTAATTPVVAATGQVAAAQAQAAATAGEVASSQARMAAAATSATRAVNDNANAVGRQRAAYAQLGAQASDVFTQLSSGTDIFRILGQQGGQVAQALALLQPASQSAASGFSEAAGGAEEMGGKLRETADGVQGFGGKVGAVAGFLAGPWGAALIGAVSLIGMFASAMGEAEDATDAAAAAEADAKKAKDDLARAAEAVTRTTYTEARANLALAQSYAAAAVKARELAVAKLAGARDELRAQRSLAGAPGQRGDNASLPGADLRAQLQVQAAERAVDAANSELEATRRRARILEVPVARLNAAAATDPAVAAGRRYEEREARLLKLRADDRISAAQLAAGIAQLERARDKETEAAGRQGRAAATSSSGRKREREEVGRSTDATREFERAQRELQSTLEGLERRFDPAAAAAREYAEALEGIQELAQAGKIGSTLAFDWEMRAAREFAKTQERNRKREYTEFLGFDPEEEFKRDMEGVADATSERLRVGFGRAGASLERAGGIAVDALTGLLGRSLGRTASVALAGFGGGQNTSTNNALRGFLFGRQPSPRELREWYATPEAERGADPQRAGRGFAGGFQEVVTELEKGLNKTFDRVFGERGLFGEA